jgi:hypothetical protein
MRFVPVLLFVLINCFYSSAYDYRTQNDSLIRNKSLAEAKIIKDERVVVEIIVCDSCWYGYSFFGRIETKKFYDSDGFLTSIHYCYGDNAFDRIEKFYYDEFRNEIRHEYLDQKFGYNEANGKIIKGDNWMFWRSTNRDTTYSEGDYSINEIEPDEYINSRLQKTVRNKHDEKGRVIERIETMYLKTDSIPTRGTSNSRPAKNSKDYVVDSTFTSTNGNHEITKFLFSEKGDLIKEIETRDFNYFRKIINYTIDGETKKAISMNRKPDYIDSSMYIRIKDMLYKDGDIILQRDSTGNKSAKALSWQVTEKRSRYRKHRPTKEELWINDADSNSYRIKVTHRYDRFGNEKFTKRKAVGKHRSFEIRRWKYTRDSLLLKAKFYQKYFDENTKKYYSRIDFLAVNKYSDSGKLVYSKRRNFEILASLRKKSSMLPLKERTYFTEVEMFNFPDSTLEIKKEYDINNNLISKTESHISQTVGLIKSDEVDVIHNDRYVKERIVVDENKYMITEKLNGVLLNTHHYEVLRYSTR